MSNTYFFSMSATFRSFVQGKITLEELKAGHFVFGPHKDSFNMPIPAFVMTCNVEKPRWQEAADWITPDCLDTPVYEKWLKFIDVIKDVGADRINWTDGKNYPSKIKPLLEQEHKVFWDGVWRKIEEFKYMGDI